MKRFTVEDARDTMAKHGVKLAHATWGYVLPGGGSWEGKPHGCACALLLLNRVGSIEGLQGLNLPEQAAKRGFMKTAAAVSKVSEEYFTGLEAGFEGFNAPLDYWTKDCQEGYEDGKSIRVLEDTEIVL